MAKVCWSRSVSSAQHVQTLDDALLRLAQGHDVSIEAEADVVDDTTKEAIQHKQVRGSKDQLGANVKGAAKQLTGAGGEMPKPGYARVADVRLTPSHPLYEASPQELGAYLKEMKVQHDRIGKDIDADPNAEILGLDGTLEVRITNVNGTFRFKGPNFDPIHMSGERNHWIRSSATPSSAGKRCYPHRAATRARQSGSARRWSMRASATPCGTRTSLPAARTSRGACGSLRTSAAGSRCCFADRVATLRRLHGSRSIAAMSRSRKT